MLLRHASLSALAAAALCLSASAVLAGNAAPTAAPGGAAAAAAVKPPIASFFQHPAFGRVQLSPSGLYLAVCAAPADGKRRDFLLVIDLDTNEPTVVAAYDDADIGDFQWVNDKRLIFDLAEKDTGQGDKYHAPGLYAVDRDGANVTQLADRYYGQASRADTATRTRMQPWNTFMLHQRPRKDDSSYVVSRVYSPGGEYRLTRLLLLDTRTGGTQAVQGPGEVDDWWLDDGGEPRLARGTHDGVTKVYYREPAGGEWRMLVQYKAYADSPQAFEPVGFGPDGALYVAAQNGRDTRALYRYDLAAGKVQPAPVLTTDGYDFDGNLIVRHGKLLGMMLATDARSIEWLDPDMKAVQARLDQLLPATINLVTLPEDASPWMLVASYSDAVPATYALYNRETGKFNPVGPSRPAIDPKQMGRQKMVRYKTRDGLEIPALLTLPRAGGKNLPMVVLVHGGPWVKGSIWGWNAETQFLASRGYAVLEPAFRGSTGYGAHLFRAGWKQWGLAMQNDVADGTRWAIAQGVADPKRICIAGASYGGYATLMGLVNDPDLFKCGVDWVGVTDIKLMYTGSWSRGSDMTAQWRDYGMPDMIGDPAKDAAQLAATSPIEQAARIQQPVLLAYGGVDRRVPLYHGQKFYDAVTRTNKDVEWIEYPEEGHGWRLPKNQIDFWGRVEVFLDKNIGPGAQ